MDLYIIYLVIFALNCKLLQVRGQCPESHPHAYYNGRHCCSSAYEKYYEPQGSKCDNSAIQFDSLCCEGDRHIPCPTGTCANYGINSNVGYSDLCSEIKRIIDRETKAGGSNAAVRDRIANKLHPLLDYDLDAYFLLVYNPIWGGDNHWGTVDSSCIGSNYFRKNNYNIRFWFKKTSEYRRRLGDVKLNDSAGWAASWRGVTVKKETKYKAWECKKKFLGMKWCGGSGVNHIGTGKRRRGDKQTHFYVDAL